MSHGLFALIQPFSRTGIVRGFAASLAQLQKQLLRRMAGGNAQSPEITIPGKHRNHKLQQFPLQKIIDCKRNHCQQKNDMLVQLLQIVADLRRNGVRPHTACLKADDLNGSRRRGIGSRKPGILRQELAKFLSEDGSVSLRTVTNDLILHNVHLCIDYII